MSRIFGVVGFVFSVFAIAVFAQATEVTLTLDFSLGGTDSDPETWGLYLETSPDDNDGVAGYNLAVENASSVEHLVIAQGFPGPFFVKGFTLSDDANDVLFAGQNSTMPTSLLYGIGNTRFTVPAPAAGQMNFNMPPEGASFSPVLIATGTGSSTTVGGNVNLWNLGQSSSNGTGAAAADAVNVVTIPAGVIPEPSTAVLLILAMVGVTAIRR